MSTIPRPEYPRPQFFRDSWLNLNGSEWSYEFDFGQSGVARGLCASKGFSKSINVPFCPESELSGVGYTDFIPAMFYHRKLAIPEEWGGKRVLLNFGAVDYECEGFINGASVGCHRGGSSSFSFDLTNYVAAGNEYDFVLRVKDDVRSGIQASGKQSVNYASSGCHYTRVTGIWQTVWLEAVALTGLKRCRITPDWDNGAFTFTPEYWADPCDCRLRIQTDAEGKQAACGEFKAASGVSHVLPVSIRRDWSPDDPFLYDIILSIILLPFLLIVICIIALLIKLTSKGPVFYGHNRVGRYGKTIKVLKFRSMYKDADVRLKEILAHDNEAKKEWETYYKLKNDPRITTIGKFLRKTSLDELPQIFNVIKGDMSFVGPRPVIQDEIDKYYKELASYYYMVRPGITGLWQISGRNDVDYDTRVAKDSWYVLNWSVWLDIVILFKTPGAVLQKKGAY